MPRYDTIGRTYATTRRTDPYIAGRIYAALGDAHRIVNVGAGTGNYEPVGREVIAVDPSLTMLEQRAAGAAPAIIAAAEALPFADASFDVALAVLTLHHWANIDQGLCEMRRVASRQVVFLFDPRVEDFWLVNDYFPGVHDLSTESPPPPEDVAAALGATRIETVPVPAGCIDGFAGCYWNRPEAYLEPDVYGGMSSLAQLAPAVRDAGMQRLRADLASGAWDARHGHLRALREIDLGYRLVVA